MTIDGYERFTGGYEHVGPVVPGTGPILNLQVKDGMVHVSRKDADDRVVEYRLIESGWEEIAQP
jgi:DNA-binding PadR family transcriptional regulator